MSALNLSPIASISNPVPTPAVDETFPDSTREMRENLPPHHNFKGRSQLIQYLALHLFKATGNTLASKSIGAGNWLDLVIKMSKELQDSESHLLDSRGALVVRNGCYLIMDSIGSGGFSDVFATTFLAFKTHKWADKKNVSPEKPVENLIIKIAKNSVDSFEKEHRLIEDVDHKEYIDYFIEFGTTKKGKSWAINRRFEGTLCNVKYSLHNDPVHLMINFTFNMLTSLGELHKKQIRHGDIKGLNVLVRKETAILTDFGFCQKPDKEPKKVLGTEAYIDPKVFAHQGVKNILINGKQCCGRIDTLESDLYSVGKTVLWDIICKFLIEKSGNRYEITQKIEHLLPQIYQSTEEGKKFSDQQLITISKKFPYHCYFYGRSSSESQSVYITPAFSRSYEIITDIIEDFGDTFWDLEKWKIKYLSQLALCLQHEDLSKRIISIDEAKDHVRTIAHKTALTAQIAFPDLDSPFVIEKEIERIPPTQTTSPEIRRKERTTSLMKTQKTKIKTDQKVAKTPGKPNEIALLRRLPDH